MNIRALAAAAVLVSSIFEVGCGSQKGADAAKKAAPQAAPAGVMMADNRNHPLARHLELAGFRLSEKGQGKLMVQFSAVNHSNADISDLAFDVKLFPATGRVDEPAFCTFSAKVASLGPQEMENATAECTTALRIYELPDWQFIRASFQITAPSM